MRAFKLAANVPWAIRQEDLELILDVAAMTRDERAANLEATLGTIRAVQAKRSRRMDGAETVGVREGVAVLPVYGPIMRRADFFTEWSGGSTLDTLAQDLQAAVENPAVHSILLDIDSPGGEVAGIAEFAQMVREAGQKKNVVSYVDDLGASAAYWIAAAADEVILASTAQVGSIGVVGTYLDTSARDEARGLKRYQVVSSQSPHKRPDLDTDAGKGKVQELCDSLASVFVAKVAEYRGVSVETVLSDFGQGWVKVGQEAVDAGMADRVSSFESLLAELAGSSARTGQGGKARMGLWSDIRKALAQHGVQAEGEEQPPAAQPAPTIAAAPLVLTFEGKTFATADALAAYIREQEAAKSRSAVVATTVVAFTGSAEFLARTLPAERARLAQVLRRAAQDDAERPLAAAAEGEASSRFALLQGTILARRPHGLTEEQVKVDLPAGAAVLPAATEGGGDKPKPERVTHLVKLAGVGSENGKGE